MTTLNAEKIAVAETQDVLAPGHTYASITDKIASIVQNRRTPLGWYLALVLSGGLVAVLSGAIAYLVLRGVGIWGINIPVAWGFAIVNFVWWIGIGHAGTLISAILLLMRQEWRTSINRFAEAMTLFAVSCAGLFPLLHLGRPFYFYFILPYPNTMGLWPQWRSPLVWDVFAVSTYATVSLLFWYVGLIPDLATLRDRGGRGGRVGRVIYGILALGWRGSARHWSRYKMAYLLLAGLATPLVVSVHTVVGLDFAVSVVPGWHSTIFPPYFVAGAIFSGFAMVVVLAVMFRKFFGLEDFITLTHMDNMGKVMLATGWIVAFGYFNELFYGFYSGNEAERFMTVNRIIGPYGMAYWALILCNILVPQLLWSPRLRRNMGWMFTIALFVNVGMWLERYVIVITSLHRDFMPSAWGMYYPTIWDWATFIGTLGLFSFLMVLFVRFLPMIAIFEMRELAHEKQGHASGAHAGATPPAGKGHS